MIHDLSIDGIFRKDKPRIEIFNSISPIEHDIPIGPHYEALLTGDAYERKLKKFMVDYETDQCLCDRCGGFIIRKPWDFENSKLCHKCEVELEQEINSRRFVHEMLDEALDIAEIIDDNPRISIPIRTVKAWDMPHEADPKPTDNIFLWD